MTPQEFRALTQKPRRSKYANVQIVADGVRWGSKAEYARWCELKLLEKAGQIRDLAPHPHIDLIVNDKLVGVWIGDYTYMENAHRVFEDHKGKDNALSKFKRKFVEAYAGIKVRLTHRQSRRRAAA